MELNSIILYLRCQSAVSMYDNCDMRTGPELISNQRRVGTIILKQKHIFREDFWTCENEHALWQLEIMSRLYSYKFMLYNYSASTTSHSVYMTRDNIWFHDLVNFPVIKLNMNWKNPKILPNKRTNEMSVVNIWDKTRPYVALLLWNNYHCSSI